MFLKNILKIFIIGLTIVKSGYAQPPQVVYPRTIGYLSVVNPIVTFNKKGATYNFDGSYTIGFPSGINVLKSDKIGFSFEVTPFVKFSDTTSKVDNVLFHPGIIFRYLRGFSLLTRLAFETSGRYGFTIVFSKIVIRSKINNYFIAMPLPVRSGNGKPASIGAGLQFGIIF